jgi:hypothetical protein
VRYRLESLIQDGYKPEGRVKHKRRLQKSTFVTIFSTRTKFKNCNLSNVEFSPFSFMILSKPNFLEERHANTYVKQIRQIITTSTIAYSRNFCKPFKSIQQQKGLTIIPPLNQSSAPRKAAAKSSEYNIISFLKSLFPFPKAQGNSA